MARTQSTAAKSRGASFDNTQTKRYNALGEIVFVRHGQASFGTDDYDRLSPLGWQQARWLGEHFAHQGRRFHVAASGGLRRHRETAEAIAETCGTEDSRLMPGLDEMDYDVLQRDAAAAGVISHAEEDDPNAFAEQVPHVLRGWENAEFATEHESFHGFQSRVAEAVDAVTEEGRDILIVSSGGPKALMMRRVLGLGSERMVDVLLSIHNASYTRFLVRGSNLRLAEFNAIPHLGMPERAHARTYV